MDKLTQDARRISAKARYRLSILMLVASAAYLAWICGYLGGKSSISKSDLVSRIFDRNAESAHIETPDAMWAHSKEQPTVSKRVMDKHPLELIRAVSSTIDDAQDAKMWRHDPLGLVASLTANQATNVDHCYSANGFQCCRVSGDVEMTSCYSEDASVWRGHLRPEILDPFSDIRGHMVATSQALDHPLSTGSLRMLPGVNYFLSGRVTNSSRLPVVVRGHGHNVDIDMRLPAYGPDSALDMFSAELEYLINEAHVSVEPLDSMPDFGLMGFESFEREDENESDFVRLFARGLSSRPRLRKRDQNTGRDIMFGKNQCPMGYENVRGRCYLDGYQRVIEARDFLMDSYAEEEKDVKTFDATRVTIWTYYRRKAETRPIHFMPLQIRVNSKSRIPVYYNGVKRFVSFSQKLDVQTDFNGTVQLDFPPAFSTVILINAPYFPTNKWVPYGVQDAVVRLSGMSEKDYEELLPTDAKGQGVKNVRQAFRSVLIPARQSQMRALTEHRQIQTNGLQKRSLRDRILSGDELEYVDEDEHVEQMLFGSGADESPTHWEMDIAHPEGPQYTTFTDRDEFEQHLNKRYVASEVTLSKRNIIRDIFDTGAETTRHVVNKIKEGIYELASEIDRFMVEKGQGDGPFALIIRGIHRVTKAIITIIVKTVREAVEFVRGIFHRVGVAFKQVIEKIKARFGLTHIGTTGQFLAHHMRRMSGTIKLLIEQNLNEFNDNLEEFQEKAFAALDKFGEKFGGRTVQTLNAKNAPERHDPRTTFFQDAVRGQIKQPRSRKNPGNPFVNQDVDLLTKSESEEFLNNAREQLDPAEYQAFQQELRQNMGVFKGGFLSMAMDKFVAFLKSMVTLSLKLARVVMTLAAKLLTKTFEMFDRILNARIHIPLVTALFEKVITGGKARLTGYNLFALLGAVPATIAYHAKFKRPPLTKEQVHVLIRSKDVNHYVRDVTRAIPGTDPRALAFSLSFCIGQTYVVAHGLYAAVSVLNQYWLFPIRFIQGYFMSFTQYIMQINSVPFNWDLDGESPSYKWRKRSWLFAIAGFLFHKGNPTLFGLLMPPIVNAIFQTVIAIPRLATLIISLVVDVFYTQDRGGDDEVIAAAFMRYIAFTCSTVSQFMEFFATPPTQGLDFGGSINPMRWSLDVATYAYFFVSPPTFVAQFSVAIAQNVLQWVATSIHTARLYASLQFQKPFLNG